MLMILSIRLFALRRRRSGWTYSRLFTLCLGVHDDLAQAGVALGAKAWAGDGSAIAYPLTSLAGSLLED
jgi:hypothetical protein